ncbi:hypothetical protein MGQ_00590 [Candida albicans P76067]|uniref:Uncharacterized protein n=1 Tax=Candida albicans (strain WO-1) TaxID=294748 RepID=C4YE40_CANAW|nr:conserved hypothetical protein [Candida albicans WO-1]KHC43435.1 hypothetical protein MGQ_00590 [Candida albicans P76067]KHC83382.1 hypothetical protein W5Q_00598 [Candida albicans SC5314]
MLLLLVKNFNINIPFNFLEIVPFFSFFCNLYKFLVCFTLSSISTPRSYIKSCINWLRNCYYYYHIKREIKNISSPHHYHNQEFFFTYSLNHSTLIISLTKKSTFFFSFYFGHN